MVSSVVVAVGVVFIVPVRLIDSGCNFGEGRRVRPFGGMAVSVIDAVKQALVAFLTRMRSS
ncbi:hypothetical protein PU630_10220 [Microbacterium horticulturae]|uniref:Uncharacterized protein n=1 Tax=Microbacterium horticulturae TaxID=3028316 RepID=A0ABY8BTY7_9MICO|nr:hypothetical protein [Microbacterium sp. KACC 23027]WEG07631.1 hypothetical protein PU630_10220 [Microbacterium sp. KACC 23027]